MFAAYSLAVKADPNLLPPDPARPLAALSQAQAQAQGQTTRAPSTPVETPADPALAGHFDELTNSPAGVSATTASEAWDQFFKLSEDDGLGDLNQRAASLQRQIRDNGVTYNVYADEDGPQ
ncbi:MAG: hypothetical protein RJA34_605, partial [Pseudomonadota bacterium]